MSIRNLEFLFNPRRIAVIGASEEQGSLGQTVFRNLVGEGFRGAVYPVNQKAEAVQGVEAYKTINDIPRDVDIAVMAMPSGELLPRLEECGWKGVKGAIILCPDFHYRVDDPHHYETQIKAISSSYGFRVLGPNSIGFIRPGYELNASLFPMMPQRGEIAFISQSAALSTALLERAVSKNVGFSFFGCLGGVLDVGFADMIDFLGVDPETKAIILYIEGIRNGRRFMSAARSFSCSKPIVVVKSGKFDLSAEVVMTRSGLVAGEDKVYDAAIKRAGALRVEEMLDLFYLTETISKQRRPRGMRLAIVSNSGAPAVIAVDTLLKLNGELACLSPETREALKDTVPKRDTKNPVDLLSNATPSNFRAAVKACLEDQQVDGVLVIFSPSLGTRPKETAQAVAEVAGEHRYKPVLTTWLGVAQVKDARSLIERRGIPTFVTPEQAVRAFMYMYAYDLNLKLLLETPEALLRDFTPDKKRVQEILSKASDSKRVALNCFEVMEVLRAYGVPVIPTYKADSINAAVRAAEEIGYPVVLKIDSPKVMHASNAEGAMLNLKGKSAVDKAFKDLKVKADAKGDADAQIIVQPMIIRHGHKLILGSKKDATFGSVIIFGTGGELVEAIEDYTIGLPPLNQTLVKRMIQETRIGSFLYKQADYKMSMRHLEEAIVRFSQLVIDFPQIKEIDINPFFIAATEEGFAFDGGILLEENVLEGTIDIKAEFCPPHLSICPYPVQYTTEWVLKDGSLALIRPIKPEDEPLIDQLFKSFSETTISMRFFQRVIELRHEQLVKYCQIDYEREIALVCLITRDGKEYIVGDARLIRQTDAESAEMAVMVGDPWQGMGVGKSLCGRCITIAGDLGIKRIWMEILKINFYMMGLAARLGFRVVHEDDESARVVLEL
ncbi:MAG TPA: bifunctional acetate--CoA ligase family protein/GNAT family N-acetyltransferase [Dissulfurispiraceae bacterium]|nr:bifunctional acetate--CoA ligase family protein/GNAT family N-acetyltransferase [Dissulfurispiraceae bacterium]